MLADKELQHMRDAVASLYPQTCYILSQGTATVSDGEGGFTLTWGTVDSSACRLDVMSMTDKEQLMDSVVRPYNYFTLTMPWDVEVTENNRIEIGDYTYLVSSIDNEQAWQIEKYLRVERI